MGLTDLLKSIVTGTEKILTEVKTTVVKTAEEVTSNTDPLFNTEETKENDVEVAANDFAEAWDSVKKSGSKSKSEKVGNDNSSSKKLSEFVSEKRDEVKEEVKDGLVDVTNEFAEAAKAIGGSLSDGEEMIRDIVASVSGNAQNVVDIAVSMGASGVDYLNRKINEAIEDAQEKVKDVKETAIEENDIDAAKSKVDEKE